MSQEEEKPIYENLLNYIEKLTYGGGWWDPGRDIRGIRTIRKIGLDSWERGCYHNGMGESRVETLN